MEQTTCPQCGGTFKPETVGRLHDKVLACPYCGHICDVPDEYEVTREEVHEEGPGHVRRVRVTERRSDLPGRAMPMPGAFTGGRLDPAAMFENLKKQGLLPPDAEFKPDSKGNFTYNTSTSKVSTHAAGNMQDAMQQVQKMMGPGFNPFGDMNLKGSAGKSFSRSEEHSETHQGLSAGQGAAVVKWLVILGVVILLIVLAVKML